MGLPTIIIFNYFIWFVSSHWSLTIQHSSILFLAQVYSSEIVEFALFEVRQVPEKTNVFETQVVPLVVVWVVRVLVVMDVFALQPSACHFDKSLLLASLLWATSFVSVLGRDPSSADNDGRPVYTDSAIAFLLQGCPH